MAVSSTSWRTQSLRPISTSCTVISACECLSWVHASTTEDSPHETADQSHGAYVSAWLWCRRCPIHRRHHQDRCDERYVGHLFRSERPGLRRCRSHGGGGLRRRPQGNEGRDHRSRPSEQA